MMITLMMIMMMAMMMIKSDDNNSNYNDKLWWQWRWQYFLWKPLHKQIWMQIVLTNSLIKAMANVMVESGQEK